MAKDDVLGFFAKMPALCGCKNADRKADMIADVVKKELEGGTVHDRNGFDKADYANRSECIFALIRGDENHDAGALKQCERLAHILEWNHYLEKHGESEYAPFIEAEAVAAKAVEADYPAIASALTVDEALTEGVWND